MKNKYPHKLSSDLVKVFDHKNWQTVWKVYTLVRNWAGIVDDKIAAKTKPAYIQKNVLWIYVNDSILMHHLQAIKPELMEKIRDFMPEARITEIRWLMQPEEHKEKPSEKWTREKHLPDPAEQKAFTEMATNVENKQCREALCSLWKIFHEN